jgi:hypothetical protein
LRTFGLPQPPVFLPDGFRTHIRCKPAVDRLPCSKNRFSPFCFLSYTFGTYKVQCPSSILPIQERQAK